MDSSPGHTWRHSLRYQVAGGAEPQAYLGDERQPPTKYPAIASTHLSVFEVNLVSQHDKGEVLGLDTVGCLLRVKLTPSCEQVVSWI